MSKMSVIAALMGPERTRLDMLPYLQAKMDDMDQVLLVIAKKIGDFVPLCGGPEHAHTLVPIIESLSMVEETSVRSTTAESMCKILAQLTPANKTSITGFVALFKRLSNEEVNGEAFYSRVTACQMVHELYRAVTDTVERTSIREIYSALSRDEMIMVRRAAALALPKMAAIVEPEVKTGELLQLLKTMAADEHQNVKIVGIENCISYSLVLHEMNAATTVGMELVPIIRSSTDDPSWKVRNAVSKTYGSLAPCFPAEVVSTELLPGMVNLLQDSEADVRIFTLSGAYSFFQVVGSELFINEVSGIAQQLADDPVVTVRKNLAELCVDVTAHSVGDSPGITIFTDLVCRLLADEDSLVRLRVIKKIPVIAQEVPALCTKITPSLKIMFGESNWRLRKELVLAMPAVVKHMGTDFFTESFLPEYLARFKDGVSEVRAAATTVLPHMVNASSATWVYDNIFPTVRGMADDEYLNRLSMLDGLKSLSEADLPERFRSEVITLIVSKSGDTVANIRLRVAQVMGEAGKNFGQETFQNQLKATLVQLQSDKDRDVKYFAEESLKKNQ
eukprot:CAMPEP_0182423938 /NCGR_PEP_ID=MMETSP1167-20130531/10037_1 /TAXON_ID=2988 /ORGANISM="Mallomonas Sp, Strain CCMP3275" /LENGTH=561 /DNA_ID=CAMNT_0024603325 /DNA_START=176 /DNA_END=1864 /DNA_ORIENTATION=-